MPCLRYLQGRVPGTHCTGGWSGCCGEEKHARNQTWVIQPITRHYNNFSILTTSRIGMIFKISMDLQDASLPAYIGRQWGVTLTWKLSWIGLDFHVWRCSGDRMPKIWLTLLFIFRGQVECQSPSSFCLKHWNLKVQLPVKWLSFCWRSSWRDLQSVHTCCFVLLCLEMGSHGWTHLEYFYNHTRKRLVQT
jgi:hypothetical protein